MPAPSRKRRALGWIGALVLLIFVGVVTARVAIASAALHRVLARFGATGVRFHIDRLTPWHVEAGDVGFTIDGQEMSAGLVAFERPHWWTPSLGRARVSDLHVPIQFAGKAGAPVAAASAPAKGTAPGPGATPTPASTAEPGQASSAPIKPSAPADPPRVPFEEISIDGHVTVDVAGTPAQALAVAFVARQGSPGKWDATVHAEAPGLNLRAEANYGMAEQTADIRVLEAALDLQPWQDFLEHIVELPGGDWELAGKISGKGTGRYAPGKFTGSGEVHLREGRAKYVAKDITAEGIEADFEIDAGASFTTKPGQVRVREVRAGKLVLQDIDADVQLPGENRLVVQRIQLHGLGGTIGTEPFEYLPDVQAIDLAVTMSDVRIEDVMALTQGLPARATGRINGRFPLRINDQGLLFGTGWMELKPGVAAELQLDAEGILTGGMNTKTPSYAVLKKIESGLLKLRVGELRLDIRPPDAPEGRSAQLHIKAEPVDPQVKAPVTLDLNVNGPLEQLINLGVNSRVSVGQ